MRKKDVSTWVAFASGIAVASAIFLLGTQATATPRNSKSTKVATVTTAANVCTKYPKSKAAKIALLAEGENAFVGKLRLKANGKVPPHRDATEEFIHVLSGTGTITIDGSARKIGSGDTVYMPANALVHYQNGPSELVAIQVFAGPGPAAKYDAWESAANCR